MPYLTKIKKPIIVSWGYLHKKLIFQKYNEHSQKQIIQLQENMNRSTKLRAIDLRNDTTKVSKALFKELVKEPKSYT